MATEPEKIDLVALATELEECNLKDQKVALILGARTGALFRSQYFKKVMSQYSMRMFTELSPYEIFTECFTILQREKQNFGRLNLRIVLDKALEEIHFSFTEVCLAELVQLKYFKTLITTNTGNLLENTFETLKMTADLKERNGDRLDYLTFTPVRHSPHDIAFHENLIACKLIKIHDDVPTFIHNLFAPDADSTNSQFIKELLGLMRVKHLLIVGVDPHWDAFLLSALPDNVEKIWFVNEDEAIMQTFHQAYLEMAGPIRHMIGTNGSFDKFLRMLYWQLTNGVSPVYYELSRDRTEHLLSIHDELEQIKKELHQLRELRQEITAIHQLLDLLVKDFEDFRNGKII
jgi:hypothetical protein